MLPSTPRPPRSGDDRTRTGGLPADNRLLWPLSYAPNGWRGWDSNPRSRAHEAREDSRSSTARRPSANGSGRQESNLRSPVPETGGVACSPTASRRSRAPPAGLEPAASGLRARRHRHFDHGGRHGSRGGCPRCGFPPCHGTELRRQESNLRFAINRRASHHSTTPERNGGSRIRTCERLPAYALATRCLAWLGHASEIPRVCGARRRRSPAPPGGRRRRPVARGGRRGSRTPKAVAHPFSRRDTAPVAVLPKPSRLWREAAEPGPAGGRRRPVARESDPGRASNLHPPG